MNNKHLAITVVIALGVLFLVKDCTRKYIPTTPKDEERLKENEKERIAINDRGDVVKTVRGKGNNRDSQVAYRDSGAGETVVIIDKSGNVSVRQQTSGFVFRPGLCFSPSRSGLLVGADAQIYYIRNFGANVGITAATRGKVGETIRFHVAASYRFPFQSFRNTSVFVGYSTKGELQTGCRVRF